MGETVVLISDPWAREEPALRECLSICEDVWKVCETFYVLTVMEEEYNSWLAVKDARYLQCVGHSHTRKTCHVTPMNIDYSTRHSCT